MVKSPAGRPPVGACMSAASSSMRSQLPTGSAPAGIQPLTSGRRLSPQCVCGGPSWSKRLDEGPPHVRIMHMLSCTHLIRSEVRRTSILEGNSTGRPRGKSKETQRGALPQAQAWLSLALGPDVLRINTLLTFRPECMHCLHRPSRDPAPSRSLLATFLRSK